MPWAKQKPGHKAAEQRAYNADVEARMSPEQKEARAAKARERYAQMTPEELVVYRAKAADRHAHVSPEQRAARQAADRERYAQMSPEQKAAQAAQAALRQAQPARRATRAAKAREARAQMPREEHAAKLAARREQSSKLQAAARAARAAKGFVPLGTAIMNAKPATLQRGLVEVREDCDDPDGSGCVLAKRCRSSGYAYNARSRFCYHVLAFYAALTGDFQSAVGPHVVPGYQVSHLCGVAWCCAPAHLHLEPASVNLDRIRCHRDAARQCPHDPPCVRRTTPAARPPAQAPVPRALRLASLAKKKTPEEKASAHIAHLAMRRHKAKEAKKAAAK
jgi:hypothetical protein